ncbi:hypothetical protein ZIOFF_045702 [Zingiber officinale]|uniref:Endoplasmic reticulum transmembrane protein n=1 Tax=Zingiber officinale TaxID=94328 RepID=A0A8J5G0Y4_ZINOF|nr:hypothetical protein ZIOFF_045702 [Zingiber officinale]
MALEWVVLGYTAAAEAIMLILLTLPWLGGLHRGLVAVVRGALKPLLSVVPFCLFLLADIYWKYETRPNCEQEHSCTPSEYLRHQKSIMKSQRNGLLIASALLLYWLLFTVTTLAGRIEQLNQRDLNRKREAFRRGRSLANCELTCKLMCLPLELGLLRASVSSAMAFDVPSVGARAFESQCAFCYDF